MRFLVLCAFVLSVSARSWAAQPVSEVVNERLDLFMLATLADLYVHAEKVPKAGPNIVATIAWDVEDVARTPEFVIDRARNFEHESNTSHAETNTFRTAYAALKAKPGHSYPLSIEKMRNATLFTSLEPCPMCATTAMMAMTKAVYCMEDPGLRDIKTHAPNITIPNVYGRRYVSSESALPVCREMNDRLWKIVSGIDAGAIRPGGDVPVGIDKNGKPFLLLLDYLEKKATSIFRPAVDAFRNFRVKYPRENETLFTRLTKAVFAR